MSIEEYLAALEDKIAELDAMITSQTIEHNIDANVNLGFVRGQITFVDGSRLEFTEQLPIDRRKFRIQYMDAQNGLLARWDSAPHYKNLATFPFHKHTPQGVAAHEAITALQILEVVAKLVQT